MYLPFEVDEVVQIRHFFKTIKLFFCCSDVQPVMNLSYALSYILQWEGHPRQ